MHFNLLAKKIFTAFSINMNIQSVNSNSFKGYDARQLHGFLMSSNCRGIASVMNEIGKKEGFRVFTVSGNVRNTVPEYYKNILELWAQDYWTVLKQKLFTLSDNHNARELCSFFNLKYDFTEKITRETPEYKNLINCIFEEAPKNNDIGLINHYMNWQSKVSQCEKNAHIYGGNIFIVRGDEGEELIVGTSELNKYSADEMKSMFGVKKVILLPQMDYHLDLFIRPLDNKRILIADDKKSLEILKNGLQKFENFYNKLLLKDKIRYLQNYRKIKTFCENYEEDIENNNKSSVDEVESVLKKAGYKTIRVPGRVYQFIQDAMFESSFLMHECNYINANVLKKNNGELVYITNKSNINEKCGLTPALSEKIGFDFEEEFIKSIAPYIRREHIYFIDGENRFISEEMLKKYQGGIHCACAEIPKEVKISKI